MHLYLYSFTVLQVELLMITSRRLGDLVFCGGGWEKTETGSEAALREAKEEAGVKKYVQFAFSFVSFRI